MAKKSIKISAIRGDTFVRDLVIQQADGTVYTPQAGDVVLFTVRKVAKKNSTDPFLIQREIEDGVLRLAPEDTANIPYGKYKYDVELQFGNSDHDIDTIIPISDFELTEEVT